MTVTTQLLAGLRTSWFTLSHMSGGIFSMIKASRRRARNVGAGCGLQVRARVRESGTEQTFTIANS